MLLTVWLTAPIIDGGLINCINTLRQRQNGCHFPDDIFKSIFLNENVWILIKISLRFLLKGLINNIPALVQIMAWCRSGDKPLSDQWWFDYWCLHTSLGLNELNYGYTTMHYTRRWLLSTVGISTIFQRPLTILLAQPAPLPDKRMPSGLCKETVNQSSSRLGIDWHARCPCSQCSWHAVSHANRNKRSGCPGCWRVTLIVVYLFTLADRQLV